MGLLKKILKPISKVLDKIIPNEIKPALPYLAAFAPYMGGMQGIMGQGMMRRALMSGALNIGGQLSQEGSEGDINLLSAGLGALQGAMTAPGAANQFRNFKAPTGDFDPARTMFQKAADYGLEGLAKGSEFMATGMGEGASLMDKAKVLTIPAGQATGDLMYAQGKRDLKDLANDVVDDMGGGYSDSAYRAAIRKSMEAYGATEEEILESIIAAGYRSGGRVALRGGGVMNAKRGLVDGPGGYAGESQQNRFNFDDTFSLSERLNPRDPENELIAEHMQIGKLPHNITARILELNRGGKSYEDIAEITGVDIEDITSMLEVANNPDIIDPVDRQGKVDYNLWDEIVKERDQIRDRPEHLSYNAQGGRIGYNRGLVVNPGGYAGETAPPINDEVEDALMEAVARKFPNLNTEEWSLEKLITALQIGGVMGTEDADILDKAAGLNMITPESIGTSAQAVSRHRDYIAQGGRIGYSQGTWESEWEELYQNYKLKQIELGQEFVSKEEFIEQYQNNMAQGGRPGYRLGDEVVANTSGIGGLDGMLDLGGMEKDYRWDGGFVPIGEYEKKDDVPARLSKNEFVFTADAVRAAGGGSINKGAQRMYDTMKNLEAQPQSKRMTA